MLRFPHRPTAIAAPALALLLAGCAPPPELDATISPELAGAAYPDFAPVEQLLGPTREPPGQAAAATEAELLARRAQLQARAERLRGAAIGATPARPGGNRSSGR
ncbi:hypothetical protein [Pontibaca methylaminivorans]|uniref:Beta-barrel assembly machine subunit BamF n=1 Tax=Pontibaca methylaminivorans TaxID=515897 RepID=A0A1R3WFH8_9RHOB|nr:hypothetical protein [Pontibaca methylaminivorans]SIT76612.1 hypothetical protein SAMN05421849_0554 [Pontibaca methylaminivorans]